MATRDPPPSAPLNSQHHWGGGGEQTPHPRPPTPHPDPPQKEPRGPPVAVPALVRCPSHVRRAGLGRPHAAAAAPAPARVLRGPSPALRRRQRPRAHPRGRRVPRPRPRPRGPVLRARRAPHRGRGGDGAAPADDGHQLPDAAGRGECPGAGAVLRRGARGRPVRPGGPGREVLPREGPQRAQVRRSVPACVPFFLGILGKGPKQVEGGQGEVRGACAPPPPLPQTPRFAPPGPPLPPPKPLPYPPEGASGHQIVGGTGQG